MPENAVTSGDLGVFVDQAPEPVAAPNAHTGHFRRRMSPPCGRVLLQRPVRPMAVEENTARPHRALDQLPPAQAHTPPPQINLAEHQIRRKRVLDGLISQYQIAA